METEKVALISKSAQKGGKRFDIERPPLPRTNQKPYIFRTLHNSFLYGKSGSNRTVAKSELETDITDLRRISNSKPWRASPQPNCIVLPSFRSARIKRKGERGGGRREGGPCGMASHLSFYGLSLGMWKGKWEWLDYSLHRIAFRIHYVHGFVRGKCAVGCAWDSPMPNRKKKK